MAKPTNTRVRNSGSASQRLRILSRDILGAEVGRLLLRRYTPPGVVVDADFRIVQTRGRTGPYLELDAGQQGLHLLKIARAGLLDGLRSALHEARKSAKPARRVGLTVTVDRSAREVDVQVLPVSGAGESPHFIVLFEAPQRAPARERALRESEKRYRHIVETAGEGICMIDADHRITFVNRRFASMVREAQDRLLARSIFDFLVIEHPSREQLEQLADLARLGEVRLRSIDGAAFWAAVSTTTMVDPSSDISGFLLMFTDVTERKQLEAVRAQLALRLVNAQEDERRRVARELHDQLGQYLTGLSLGLNRLEQLHTGQPDAEELIRRLRKLADDMSRDAHHLAMELRPAALDDLGLSAAVSNYANEVARRSRLEVDVHCDLAVRLDPLIETTVYRVLQEALTNIVKHAKAKHVSIILERQDSGVRAIVEDDGVGFDVDRRLAHTPGSVRLGLVGMRERASVVGGELQIESRPGHGTTLFLRVPIKTQVRVSHEKAATAPRR
jgi:PAS domain S-box-containing protein